jgi:exodeoxyribonuclease V beta subunit
VLAFPLTGLQLIEASAGTGKTYTIANLYLRHIVEGRKVSEILVVTFTVAATDELRGRIRARLSEALGLLEHERASEDELLTELAARIADLGLREQTVKRLRLAVRTMDEAAIYTIHSFCQRALSDFAFRSGQQFHMEVLTDDSDLWRQAIQDWWRKTGYPLDPAEARLFSAGLGSLATFEALLKPLLDPQPKRLLPEVTPWKELLDRWGTLHTDLAALVRHWRKEGAALTAILRESKGLRRAQKSPYAPARLEPALALLERYFEVDEILPPPDAFELLTPQGMEGNRLKAADPRLDDPFFAQCGGIWQALSLLQRDLRCAALTDAAAFAREQVARAKRRAQALSFNDLLTEMQRALESDHGEDLADAIRHRFPAAMIDEFQDTDPIQYGLFRRLYLDQPECGLIMIGDPKQAIYSFRGGDIFTYMQAKQDVGAAVYTLETNWRSTPQVIKAVNALFQQRPQDAFVYGDTIPFHPSRAANKVHRRLYRDDEPQVALTVWALPPKLSASGKPQCLSKEEAAAQSHLAVAEEIARLIREGKDGTARLGDRALCPRDIAVLVRTSFEAADLRRQLADFGVNAVAVERSGVFETEEAAGLEQLLQAVLNPGDRGMARLALTSALLGKDYAEIAAVLQSEEDWVAWVDQLLQLHETWQRKGFMSMFQQMLQGMGIAEAIGGGTLAERRLTNLLHLGELLQQASKTQAGMDALWGWYRQRREETAGEEAELRLESDEELVQIVTIHASKGLEYPVVLVPYLWSCKPRGLNGLLGFHRDGDAFLDAGSDDIAEHLFLAEQERLAEDVRLAYVALTRAESALYLVWGCAGSRDGRASQTALAYLLHPQQAAERLATERPEAFSGLYDVLPDLQELAARAEGEIAVGALPQPEPRVEVTTTEALPELAPRPFRGSIATDWRINSFSALTRDVHSGPAAPRDRSSEDPALAFPAGSHVGSYLHLLLEHLDFQDPVEPQVLRVSAQFSPRFNLDHEHWGESAARWMARVIATPLDDQGLTLAALPQSRRLNELEFDFSTQRVDIRSLNRLLERAAGEPLPPLEVEAFQGMVTGIIDLVFEHQGRCYIADYKSNFLGSQFTDYAPQRLREAVLERRYDLQYLLYTLALHRYLRQRVPEYDYARHFGGVFYLFLRGMQPDSGPRGGVYFDRPEPHLIAELDETIFRYDPMPST